MFFLYGAGDRPQGPIHANLRKCPTTELNPNPTLSSAPFLFSLLYFAVLESKPKHMLGKDCILYTVYP